MGLQVDFDTTAREPNGKKETQGGSSKKSHTSNEIIAYYCGDVCENSSNDHSETGSTALLIQLSPPTDMMLRGGAPLKDL